MTLLRLPFMFLLVCLAVMLIFAASLIGRGIPTTMVAASLDESRPEHVAYLMADLERGLTARTAISLPGGVDARWYAPPPLVLQRTPRAGFADWTLSRIDFDTHGLVPLMTLTTPESANIRIDDIAVRFLPDGRLHTSVYVPQTGEIWVSTGDAPAAALLTTIPPDLDRPLNWSLDMSQLAIKSTYDSGLTLMNADGSDMRHFDIDANHWPMWSRDSTRILLVPRSFRASRPLTVIDTRTGTAETPFTNLSATWCGDDLVYIEADEGVPTLYFGDLSTGESELLVSSETFPGFDLLSVTPLDAGACEWLIVLLDGFGGSLLLHRPTRHVMPLGVQTQVIERGTDTLIYQALGDGDDMEIRRIALTPDADGFETLAAFPRDYVDVRWIEGWQRGIVNESSVLSLLELPDLRVTPLTLPDISQFMVIE